MLIAILLSGCAAQNNYKVEGWPPIPPTHIRVSFMEVQRQCWDYFSPIQKMMIPLSLACTKANLYKMTCNIYSFSDLPESIIKHEEDHCSGWTHDAEVWQAYYDKWNSLRKKD